jgi:hypothetical protein
MRISPARATALLVPLLATLASGASMASASPWWHLTSSSRPTYLQRGEAEDEVQKLTLDATEGELILQGTLRGESLLFAVSAGEPPRQVEENLEEKYGPGNVRVTSPGTGLSNPYEVYEIKFTGALAEEAVGAMTVYRNLLEGGAAQGSVRQLFRGRTDGVVAVTAVNLGDANADPEAQPVTIADALPPELEAVKIEGTVNENLGHFGAGAWPLECSLGSLTCTFTGTGASSFGEEFPAFVPPFDQIQVLIAVNLRSGAKSGELNEATVTGGGAPSASARQSLTVSDEPLQFGLNTYEMRPEQEGGAPATQAGSHPYQLTTTLRFNENFEGRPAGLAKDLHLKLPPGLIGNPTPFAQCKLVTFVTLRNGGASECPSQTQVGVARTTINLNMSGTQVSEGSRTTNFPIAVPLYNLEPEVGEPARFGFIAERVPVILDTAVRTGGDYGVTVSVTNITQEVEFLNSEVTVWGVPGAHGTGAPQIPLLTLPTSCPSSSATGQPEPLQTTMEADSWQAPHALQSLENTALMPAIDGCNLLQFEPSIGAASDGRAASTPTGLTVGVHVPQEVNNNASGLAGSDIKNIAVTLPAGMTLNPSAADGLQACSEGQIGYLPGESKPPSELHFTPRLPGSVDARAAGETGALQPGVNFCPDASKIATVKIKTPLLPNALEGAVYLASPQNFAVFPQENPFGSLIAMYIVAEDPVSGALVKLPGDVSLNQGTGQIESTFENTPQLAFEDAEIHFYGGERAPLSTPAHCGTYTTQATFTPWSGGAQVSSQSSFQITSGPNGTACPGAALPFSPSLTAGMTNINAAAFSPLTTTITREDGQQNIQTVQLHMPAGLSGILAGVKLCPEAEANAGACGAESKIGSTIVSVGLGGDPYTVKGGEVFLTEKVAGSPAGAPFGLSIVNPAVAGPFNLGKVVVRAQIAVDPHTAQLTITTGTIPHILDGIPLQIKHVNVTVERPGFTFNPTDCNPAAVTGTIGSVEGTSSPVQVPFQVTNCASLKFAPKFSVSTSGKTSKANGASLTAKLAYPVAPQGTQANITRVKVDLPKALPSRLTTLQKACTNKQFELNPAGCPSESKIGYATVTTPLLPVPLSGPAVFVSHGGEAFPSLTMVLQGYGVTVDLVGTTFISKQGITSTTFKTVPDVPFNTFQLTLPQGKYSALAANGNLCTSKLTMPTEFLAQNGAKINESTPVSVTGCAKAKALTRAQKLAAALKTCHKKTNKTKRTTCERIARKRYTPQKKSKKTKK